jgi:protein TonB
MLALRLPFVAASGFLVALSVFALLWRFVNVPMVAARPEKARNIEFTRTIVEQPVKSTRDPKPVRKPPPEVVISPRVTTEARGIPGPTPVQRTSFTPSGSLRPTGMRMRPDGDAIPIVRPAPEYPQAQITRGTEGWVRVRFTITEAGTVKDATVVAAEPERVFDAAALKAIARWRYNPRVENGMPVARVGLETVIRFDIE